MSDFGSEAMFDRSNYEINEHLNDAFHDHPYLLSKALSRKDQQSFGPSATSPSISSSQSIQPSHSAMSHSSTMSGNSTSSSDMGSPFVAMHPDMELQFDEWTKNAWSHNMEPSIFQNNAYPPSFINEQIEDGDQFQNVDFDRSVTFVTPNTVQPYMSLYQHDLPSGFMTDFTTPMQAPFPIPSPVPTRSSTYESPVASAVTSIGSTLVNPPFSQRVMSRQASVGSPESTISKGSPPSITAGFEDDSNERGRCPYPGCGRVFKDLRAHKLTHQSERPEKCPIEKCQYHTKGFARKYDQTRHTLTHYKGTMVCGFCPGSGSASEKSFNRADVFKRHLTSVHGVEQTPANCRRKTPNTVKKASSKDENKEGKCSTCGSVFSSAQDFYNHLDDCVMKILEKPEVSEAHNERHLTDVSGDQNVKVTLERNNLPVEVQSEFAQGSDEEDDEMEDDDEEIPESKGQASSHRATKATRGMTRSKGGVPTVSKGRRKRKDYPHSWNCGKEHMKMKKRVLCVFDGQRRLCKDEMMMDNEYEVRIPLDLDVDSDQYVTDLDYMTLKRAGAIHDATEEEKGPYLKDEEVTKLML